MGDTAVGHVHILVTATGETGTVDPDEPGPNRMFYLDNGEVRLLGGDECIRLLPPKMDFGIGADRAGGDYGVLTDITTGEQIRPATPQEHARSVAAGFPGTFIPVGPRAERHYGRGAFDYQGMWVTVTGGPDEPAAGVSDG